MRCTTASLSLILAAALSSCAGNKPAPDDTTAMKEPVGVENARFLTGAQPFREVSPTGTFNFVVPFELPDDPRVDAGAVERRLRSGRTRELARKGYTHGGVDPVFLVKVRLVLDEKVDAFAPVRIGGQESEWVRPVEGDASFEKGALIVDLLDPEDQWTLWRGVCGANILTDVAEEQKDRRIEMIVARLLEGFPPES